MSDTKSPDYLTMDQVADLYGVSNRTVRRMIDSGELPAVRVGKRSVRILREDALTQAAPIDRTRTEQTMTKYSDFPDPSLLPDFVRGHRLAMLAIEDPDDPAYDGEQELLPTGTSIMDAEVLTSWTGEREDVKILPGQTAKWEDLANLPETFHRPVLDLDFDAELFPSTSADHHHLYLDKVLTWSDYVKLLDVLAEVGIIEPGYRDASIAREFTSVRLPWITKAPREAILDIEAADREARS